LLCLRDNIHEAGQSTAVASAGLQKKIGRAQLMRLVLSRAAALTKWAILDGLAARPAG
jgi:hypothetical protein